MSALFCVLTFLWGVGAAVAQDFAGDGLKSQHLYNLAKFITWPESKFPGPDAPLRVGFVGTSGVRDLFEEANKSTRVASRSIVTISVHSNKELKDCHILFVGVSDREGLSTLLNEARKNHVLTVGHSDVFIQRGGMVNFRRNGSGIRMQINERQAKRANLRLNARLLSVAELVDNEGRPVARKTVAREGSN